MTAAAVLPVPAAHQPCHDRPARGTSPPPACPARRHPPSLHRRSHTRAWCRGSCLHATCSAEAAVPCGCSRARIMRLTEPAANLLLRAVHHHWDHIHTSLMGVLGLLHQAPVWAQRTSQRVSNTPRRELTSLQFDDSLSARAKTANGECKVEKALCATDAQAADTPKHIAAASSIAWLMACVADQLVSATREGRGFKRASHVHRRPTHVFNLRSKLRVSQTNVQC